MSALLPDSIVTVAGAGSLKFSGRANLLAMSNPLATVDLPSPFGSIAVKEGANVPVITPTGNKETANEVRVGGGKKKNQ